ncbi:serpin B [Nocardiopsis sp. Huas11]|uniref:serpin family protein n=1 Tax=Nocardiopsis sp. Huas11 TaxID=2183912 RepID=UPI000EB2473E|nr:serpin family protein [Nocardiopsis sp. Huas11]RKS07879.1 serpin B [Nocardiopsis sp. Huas11]
MHVSTQPRTDHLAFAAALDRALTREGASHVWSPHSVGTVLGLLATAAAARTRDELVGLLGEDLLGQLAALDEAVAGADGLDLATLNGLYVPDDLPVRADFMDQVRSRGGAEVESAGFRDDPDGVRERINAKVGDVTRGLIPRLLPFGSVSPDTRLLLVNALWVKMVWSDPFETSDTRERPFHAPGGRHSVPTMHRTGRMPYASARGWSMVSLEGEHDLTLDVLLPDAPKPSLPPVTAEALTALYQGLRPTQVELALPRFAVDTDSALLEPLAELGVAEFARDTARFDGISEEPLKVDALLHQSVLRVDEKGAEGAAATAAVMVMAAAVPVAPVRFAVDRPFVVVLRRRGAVLFLGRVTDPVDPGPAQD